mmetsp:Transcript_25412/g.63738  ORF Transcript_25412/g.63738 Transcript_25412/m.63738 type:complete len:120 (-) Transcript_25412:497-856(-)
MLSSKDVLKRLETRLPNERHRLNSITNQQVTQCRRRSKPRSLAFRTSTASVAEHRDEVLTRAESALRDSPELWQEWHTTLGYSMEEYRKYSKIYTRMVVWKTNHWDRISPGALPASKIW